MTVVRPLQVEDFAAVVGLQRLCFPDPFPADTLWTSEHLASHLRFPEGQWVATLGDQVVASSTSMRVSLPTWSAHLPWEEVTGGLSLPKHDPAGEVLYGIDISVHPSYRGQGIARKLYEKRFALVDQLGLVGYGTVCRIPGFAASGQASPEAYIRMVADGRLVDQTLSPLLRLGLNLRGVIMDYMQDEESGNAGAILERWR